MKLKYKDIGDELNLGKLISTHTIQTLWSGYGELVRLQFENKSIIVKYIKLPQIKNHPKGWNTDVSHRRKIHSYQVEVNWYKEFSQTVDQRCRIPQGFRYIQEDGEWLIVMEDLASLGLKYTSKKASKNHLKSSLTWLANFHAKYMGKRSELIWGIGTYWHLDTRPDELEALRDSQLKNKAKQIDSILNNAKYQTIVHGDAKLANFCFNNDGSKCAAVDFQYVGHGCGMKDVVYFMSSSIKPSQCVEMQEWVLNVYFRALKKALKNYQPHLDSDAIEEEYRAMYAIAWADFYRFLKGWSPDHYKINKYSQDITREVLASDLLNHL